MNYGRGVGGRTGGRPFPFLPSGSTSDIERRACVSRVVNRATDVSTADRTMDDRVPVDCAPLSSKDQKTSKPSGEISTADDCWGVR